MRFLKSFSVLLVILSVFSCSENLDITNDPALQAQTDAGFFAADAFGAVSNDDGTVSVTALNDTGILNLELESAASGIYAMEPGSESFATFNRNGELFSTNYGSGRGELMVFDTETPNSVSVEFDFVAYTVNGQDSLFMRQGMAYQVPFGNPIITPAPVENLFSAQVDDEAFEASRVFVNKIDDRLNIIASKGIQSQIILRVPANIDAGSYDLESNDFIEAVFTQRGVTATAIRGTIIIEENNTRNSVIKATFEFTTGEPDYHVINEGNLVVSY